MEIRVSKHITAPYTSELHPGVVFIPPTSLSPYQLPARIVEIESKDPIVIRVSTFVPGPGGPTRDSAIYRMDEFGQVYEAEHTEDARLNCLHTLWDLIPNPFNKSIHGMLSNDAVVYAGERVWINKVDRYRAGLEYLVYIRVASGWIETTAEFMRSRGYTLSPDVYDEWLVSQNLYQS